MTFDEFKEKHPGITLTYREIPERTDGLMSYWPEPSEFERDHSMVPRHYVVTLDGPGSGVVQAFQYSKGAGHLRWKPMKEIRFGRLAWGSYGSPSLLGRGVFANYKAGERVGWTPSRFTLAESDLWPLVTEPILPELDEFLESVSMDWPGVMHGQSFSDWCAEYGYDDDSIKAQKIFHACLDSLSKGRRAIGWKAVEDLMEVEW